MPLFNFSEFWWYTIHIARFQQRGIVWASRIIIISQSKYQFWGNNNNKKTLIKWLKEDWIYKIYGCADNILLKCIFYDVLSHKWAKWNGSYFFIWNWKLILKLFSVSIKSKAVGTVLGWEWGYICHFQTRLSYVSIFAFLLYNDLYVLIFQLYIKFWNKTL